MNFNSLMAKMRELDQPAVAAAPIEECGEPMMGMNAPMSNEPPHTPPSLSVNLNAQGMDDIESIMRLMTKVNPDMINQPSNATPMPALAPMPGMQGPSALPPLKMLPDFDKEEPEIGGEIEMDIEPVGNDKMNGADDGISKAQGDIDNDGDHDMDDHEAEKDEAVEPEDEDDDIMSHLNKELKPYDDQVAASKEKETKEGSGGFDQATTRPEPGYKDIDYMVNKLSGGLGKEQTMVKHGYKNGDNPYAMPESSLRTQIRAELMQRLEEAKKGDVGKHNNATTGFKALAKKAGGGEKGEKIAGAQYQKMKKAGQL
jgi:hypothetical protein